MTYSRTVLATCAGLLLGTLSSFAGAQTTSTLNLTGRIHFLNDKNEEKCVLAVPEKSKSFNFSNNTEYCENNMVTSFWLEQVPSATLINFYENETCSDAQVKNNFYFKLKTVKQPTDWSQPPNAPATQTIDDLRTYQAKVLLSGKNTRVEETYVGSDFATDNLNERISCVYIERSQPVN